MLKTKNDTRLLTILYSAYAGAIIVMNILATKQFDMGIFTVTTGILVSPIAFIIQDVTTEVYGFKEASRMIITGFTIMLTATLLYQLAIALPSSQFWEGQEAFETILGTTFRISLASLFAYIVGSLMNSWIMDNLRGKYEDQLFFRVISSTIAGQLLDNFIFAFVAFFGVLPIGALISMGIGGTLFEVIYEIIIYPVTRWTINKADTYIKED